jgi:hypothetical protein
MCDYCGCRQSGPTAELAHEHVRLQELGGRLRHARETGAEAGPLFDEFVRLLQMHAAKEEVGLFVHARSTPLAARIDELCGEHDDLNRWLSDGPDGAHVDEALRLLATHIDDEEFDLFPHVFHMLDPEQWEDIELAHRAVEAVWGADDTSIATSAGRRGPDDSG